VAQQERNPIVTGLVALVSVGLVVGLVLGVVTLVATRVLGLSGDNGGTSSADQTLYLPTPTPTPTPSGPLVTLSPGKGSSPSDETSLTTLSALPTEASSTAPQITLSAGETSVAPMQRIDLTGIYPGGEGAILQVQRKLDGKWQDFLSVNVAVSGGQFSTYVQTGQTGQQQFRMRDTSSGLVSNVVRVQVG
jgi:hypothetical protein